MKNIANLRQMSNDQLRNRLIDIGNSLIKYRGLNNGHKPMPNNDSLYIRKWRKDKARILTILRERELKKMRKKV